MAVLSESDRRYITRMFMQRMSRDCDPMPADKFDIKLTVDKIDNWLENRWQSLLDDFPAAVDGLTNKEKTELIRDVVHRKWGVL